MKKTIVLTGTVILVIVLFCMQLIVSNRLATTGAELSSMQNETAVLVLENEQLRHTIASHSSLMVISKEAQKMGFLPASVEYLNRPPVAFKQ